MHLIEYNVLGERSTLRSKLLTLLLILRDNVRNLFEEIPHCIGALSADTEERKELFALVKFCEEVTPRG